MAGKGSKQLVRELINFYKVNRGGYPYEIIYKLIQLYQVIEDVYSVSTVIELQEAIDNIGTDAGTIFIASGTYDVTTTIDIDNCGSLVIYGHGDNTILKAADGITIFNITCVASCLIKTLKLDITNYTGDTQAVLINETNNNIVGFEDVSILGAAANGIGIEVQSDNCYIDQCNILQMKTGIYLNGAEKTKITGTLSGLHVNYGLHLNQADFSIITGNSFTANTSYGIYIYNSDYCIISNTGCTSNLTGMYSDISNYNTISSCLSNSNSENGIFITQGNYNTISSNTLNNNDSNIAGNTAGLYITNNSDFNTITANSINNNNNSGAGTAYGIYIATADCDENVVASNNANGNDVDYQDSGTSTTVIYYVQNSDELQDAIDSIGSSAGTIYINSSFTVSTTIDIDGGGSYLIEGEGSNTVLTTGIDIKCLNVDLARQCILRNFRIDASAYTAAGVALEIIDVNENNNDLVILDNVSITGDGTNGYGIELNSNNCRIENCEIDNISIGINILSTNNIISGNNVNNCNTYGIQISSANTNNVTTNIVDSNTTGIYLSSSDYVLVSGNSVNTNTENGIELTGSDYTNISGNSCIGNDSSTANPQAGMYISTDSNNNSIIGNTIINNNNAGAGIGYGVYIGTATCDENIVRSNNISGNDTQWGDTGTNTQIEYFCLTEGHIQDAVDSIAGKAGTIIIGEVTIAITTGITVDNATAKIRIIGKGQPSILQPTIGITVFTFTNAYELHLEAFYIDMDNYTADTTKAIFNNGANCLRQTYEDITFEGTADGIAIYNSGDSITVNNCYFNNVFNCIYITGSVVAFKITGNEFWTIRDSSVYIDYGEQGVIANNIADATGGKPVIDVIRGKYISISNNQIITGGSTATNGSSIQITGAVASSDIQIVGNTIRSTNSSGTTNSMVYMSGTVSRITISSNVIISYTNSDDSWGIIIEDATVIDCTITGNSIYAFGGIKVVNADNMVISGNKITGNTSLKQSGILLEGSIGNAITSNIIDGVSVNFGTDVNGISLTSVSTDNIIANNRILDMANAGAGDGYGIIIAAGCNNNVISGNVITSCDTNLSDAGTGTILFGDDTAYGAGWNGDLGTPTKNVIYDQFVATLAAAVALISDTAYAASWDGVTTIAPSKNAVYDKIQALIAVWG
ncbi:hypothetical protein LCGC14_0223700 [marine sediment metagenome]|uniref:Right handed beta helix domain-containing protein n=1 Tax=marine sediment metagenome TaxID=412755 RepID=A0A0F9UTJ3_9ZZZZ